MANPVNIKNKKASFQYHFLETYTAGIQLKGTEIKSIRAGEANLSDAHCLFKNNELYIKGMHIAEYRYGNHFNHDPLRERKLLLNKNELNKLRRKSQEKGLAIVALRLFINEKGFAKLDIALAKGKQMFDKREDIKKRDTERNLRRVIK